MTNVAIKINMCSNSMNSADLRYQQHLMTLICDSYAPSLY